MLSFFFFLQMSPLVGHLSSSSNSNRQGNVNSIRSASSLHGSLNINRGWSASCLRPAPPLPPCLSLGSNPNGSPIRPNRKPLSYKEDGFILEVIEAYCSSVVNRNAVNSGEILLRLY